MTDTSKSIDAVIAYNKESLDIKCKNNDVLLSIPDTKGNITKICRKFIQKKELDPKKNPCPFGSELYNSDICVGIGSNYPPNCEPGYDKIDNMCYKSCNDDYITVNINKINGYEEKDEGSKCINENINHD